MTEARASSRYRQVRLCLNLARTQTVYTLTMRTVRGEAVFDRRLSLGAVDQRLDPDDPEDVLALLERIVHDLQRRHGAHFPAQRPGAPGGGGGRPGHTPPSAADTVPLSVVRDDP